MPQNDEFDLTFIQTVHNTRVTNVLVYRQTSADGAGDARQALADGFLASTALTAWTNHQGTSWVGLCAEVRQRNNQGQDFFRVLAVGVTGSGNTLNPATAVQLTFKTSGGGVGQNGKLYVSGAATIVEDENNLNNIGYPLFVDTAEKLILPIVNSGYTFQLGLPSRPGPPDNPTALPFRDFVLADARVPLTKIQSRRLNTKC